MNKNKIMITLSVVFSLAVLLAVFLVTPVQVKAETVDFTDVSVTSFVSSTNSSLYSYSDHRIEIDAGWKSNQIYFNVDLTDSNGDEHLCIYNNGLLVKGSLLDTFTITFPYLWDKFMTFYKPVDYYPYNIWDEEYRSGYYTSHGHVHSDSYFCNVNPVPVTPNTSYYIVCPFGIDIWGGADSSGTNLTLLYYSLSNTTFVTGNDTYYIYFNPSANSGPNYNHNVSIYLASKSATYYIPHYSYYDVPLECDSVHIPNYTNFTNSSILNFDLYSYISTTPLNAATYNIATSNFISSYNLSTSVLQDSIEYNVINLDFSGLPVYQNYNYYVYFFIFPTSDITKSYFYYCYNVGGLLTDLILDYYAINDYWNEDYDGMSLSTGFTPCIYNNLGFDKTDQYNDGYSNGYNTGYSSGLNYGNSSGYTSGYAVGYSKGFEDGETMNVGDPTVTGLIYSIFQAPVTVLMNLFSFTIFGTQVWYILVTLLVLGLVLWLLRKLLLR